LDEDRRSTSTNLLEDEGRARVCDDPAFLQSAGTVVTLVVEHDHSSRQIALKLKDIL
jgi:hypothetical protein